MREQLKMMGVFLGLGIELCLWVYIFYYIFEFINAKGWIPLGDYAAVTGAMIGLSLWTYRVYKVHFKINSSEKWLKAYCFFIS